MLSFRRELTNNSWQRRMILNQQMRPADPSEAPFLSELTIRSKAHWGYGEAFMTAARPALEFRAEKFRPDFLVYVLEVDNLRVGFCSMLPVDDDTVELHDLFIDPAHIGCGHGKRLWLFALDVARGRGFKRLILTADPNAEPFYSAQGARRIGEQPSPVQDDRLLPVLEYLL
jgi:GNAT superfamily N-acetyltransferase